MEDFQAAPGAPAAQGGQLGRLRPPDLLGLADRRRRDRPYRPLPPPDLEARELCHGVAISTTWIVKCL